MLIFSGILSRPLRFCLLPVAVAGIILSVSGCKEITEADTLYIGQVTIFNSELEEIGSILIDESPGCLMTFPGHLIITTKEGSLLLYDSESLEMLGEYKVGPAAPEGYSEMIYNPSRNSAYLIGAYGNILDIDLPECTVENMFSVCQLPLDLIFGGDDSPYFYATGGIDNKLYRVNTSTNNTAGFVQFDEGIRTVTIHAPDSILVSSRGGTYIVFSESLELMISIRVFMADAKSLGTIWNRDYTAAVFGGNLGIVSCHLNEDSTHYVWTFDEQVEVEGNPFDICCNEIFSAYLLSYTWNETSALYRYDYSTGNIMGQVEIQGYPLDLKVTDSNNVFVLTALD